MSEHTAITHRSIIILIIIIATLKILHNFIVVS